MHATMPPDLSDISIVVLSFNRKDTLEGNLTELTRLVEETGCELIVVDNASTDGSVEMIGEVLAGRRSAHFIANEANLGVATGRNVGWREASRNFILNLDDDIGIAADDVLQMAEILRRSRDIGVVGPRIVDRNSGDLQYGYGNHLLNIANFQGACHMIRRDVAAQLGFNDELCSFGAEEIDLSIRVRAAGFNVVFTPEATALHDHKTRTGQEARNRRERWVYNFTRVFYKHFPLAVAVPFSLRCFASHLVSGIRAFGPSFGLKLTRAAFCGCRDGRSQHSPVPAHVVRFYRDPELRPEFGNRPVWRKLVDRHLHQRIKTSSPSMPTRSRLAARDR